MRRRVLVVTLVVLAAVGMSSFPRLGARTRRSMFAQSGSPSGAMTVVITAVGPDRGRTLELATGLLRDRVDHLGVIGSDIVRHHRELIVHLEGVTDAHVAELLVAPFDVRFRPVLANVSAANTGQATTLPDQETARGAVESCDPAAVLGLTQIPTTTLVDDTVEACVVLPLRRSGKERAPRELLGPAELTTVDVASAKKSFVPGNGYVIDVKLTKE